MTASRPTGGATAGAAVVVVAAESVDAFALAVAAGVPVGDESPDFVAGSDAALASPGYSTDAVCTEGSIRTACCVRAISGMSPQHTMAAAGIAFLEMLFIQPLTFTKDLGMNSLWNVQREAGISSAAPQACLSSQVRFPGRR